MAIRNIVTGAENEALRKPSRVVTEITQRIITLIDDMKETLGVEEGVGLAAPQVGVLRRIAVIEYEEKSFELINPKILESSGEEVREEGCLSLPGEWGMVPRPDRIVVTYMDRNGKKHKEEITGILARVFCHEIDHLDGVLYIDKAVEEEAAENKESGQEDNSQDAVKEKTGEDT